MGPEDVRRPDRGVKNSYTSHAGNAFAGAAVRGGRTPADRRGAPRLRRQRRPTGARRRTARLGLHARAFGAARVGGLVGPAQRGRRRARARRRGKAVQAARPGPRPARRPRAARRGGSLRGAAGGARGAGAGRLDPAPAPGPGGDGSSTRNDGGPETEGGAGNARGRRRRRWNRPRAVVRRPFQGAGVYPRSRRGVTPTPARWNDRRRPLGVAALELPCVNCEALVEKGWAHVPRPAAIARMFPLRLRPGAERRSTPPDVRHRRRQHRRELHVPPAAALHVPHGARATSALHHRFRGHLPVRLECARLHPGRHVRRRVADVELPDRDAVRPPVQRWRLGRTGQRVLGRGVGDRVRAGRVRRDGTVVDDPGRPAGPAPSSAGRPPGRTGTPR